MDHKGLTIEDLDNLYKKIYNQFHKTRLTHEFYLKLEPDEVMVLLDEIHYAKIRYLKNVNSSNT